MSGLLSESYSSWSIDRAPRGSQTVRTTLYNVKGHHLIKEELLKGGRAGCTSPSKGEQLQELVKFSFKVFSIWAPTGVWVFTSGGIQLHILHVEAAECGWPGLRSVALYVTVTKAHYKHSHMHLQST